MSSKGRVWWWPVTAEGEAPDYPPTFLGTVADAGNFALDMDVPVVKNGDSFVIETVVDLGED